MESLGLAKNAHQLENIFYSELQLIKNIVKIMMQSMYLITLSDNKLSIEIDCAR